MPGRSFTSSSYRYGFNGKENDPESGTQDYGFRIYNPNLGKFLSVDPLTPDYPELTPYQFASNTPIMATDLDGLEVNPVVRPVNTARPIMTNRPGNGGYPSGRSAGRGRGTWTAPSIGDNVETNLTIEGHTNYKFVDQNVWFDANGHPQTDVVETPAVKPIEDPTLRKLGNNLLESKLEESQPKKPAIGLAVDENLDVHRGIAVTYKRAGWQEAGLTKVDWGRASMDEFSFKSSFWEASKNASAIRFYVEGLNESRKMTMWEFNQIINDPALLKKTTFFDKSGELIFNGTSLNKK